ncbi:MAG: hypothetical protein NC115_04695 [Bacteroidales bacterium]|nr:hypothetical protein [Bacteroidales bacterium]
MDTARLVFLSCFCTFLGLVVTPAFAQEQQKEPDMIEIAEKEADRLQALLDLDDWQVFYVDSTLKHDFPAMHREIEDLGKAKVSNSSLYVAVQDRWMDTIELSYRKIFNDEQWAAYLKSGAAKQQKARAKRREKAEAALAKRK